MGLDLLPAFHEDVEKIMNLTRATNRNVNKLYTEEY